MALGQIGQNGTEEFFETIFYGVAYDEAKDKLKDFTQDVDNELLQEALAGAGSIIVSGIMFQLMRTQEGFIDKVFAVSKGLVVILLGSDMAQKMGKKMVGKMKGVKLFKKLSMFKSNFSDRVATAQLVIDTSSQHFQADDTMSNDLNRINVSTNMKASVIEKEKLNQSVASSMTANYNETLMLKMATKSFNDKDKTILKKILGKDGSAELDITEMNQVADFMFVKDANGEMTGLSEQMFSLLNGMGYMNKPQ